MNEITIKIGGVDYKIKQSFRSLMLFENLTGKPVGEAVDSVNTIMMMFYCIIKANNKNFEFDFEQFVDLIDDNSESIEVFTEFLQNQVPAQAQQQAKKKKRN